jgi:integrase
MDRRNIDYFKATVGGFSGWKVLEEAMQSADNNRAKGIFLGLLKLGCRASELGMLKRGQVDMDFSDENIQVRGMYVEKHKTRIALKDKANKPIIIDGKIKYTYKSKPAYRTFYIRKDEPMSDYLVRYVNKFPKSDQILFPYNRFQVYYSICNIGSTLPPDAPKSLWWKYRGEWYPHRLRSERCCSLIKDFNMDTARLKTWFGWRSDSMASEYGEIQAKDLIVTGKVNY